MIEPCFGEHIGCVSEILLYGALMVIKHSDSVLVYDRLTHKSLNVFRNIDEILNRRWARIIDQNSVFGQSNDAREAFYFVPR